MRNLRLLNRRTYNSGKISGIDKYKALIKFERADKEIQEIGLDPVNPLKSWIPSKAPYWIHIIADLTLLTTCSTIYLQNDWEESRGAKIEKRFAKLLGKRVLTKKELVNTREVNEATQKKEAFKIVFLRNTKFHFKPGDKRIASFMEIAKSLGVTWREGVDMAEEEKSAYFPAYGRLFVWENELTQKLHFAHGGTEEYFEKDSSSEISVDYFFEVWNALKQI